MGCRDTADPAPTSPLSEDQEPTRHHFGQLVVTVLVRLGRHRVLEIDVHRLDSCTGKRAAVTVECVSENDDLVRKADLDLGGLALTDLHLSTGASESEVDVSEPNTARIRTARFEVGAAEFTARNLGNLNADRIEVDAGVGSLTLGLDGRWRRDAEVSVDMGLGSLELLVPEGLGVRLRKDSFLTSLDSEGLVKRGDVYESLDFDDADRRVTIDIDAAFGSVAVVWIN